MQERHGFVVYGRKSCPFCQKICGVLECLRCPYNFFNLSNELISNEVRQRMSLEEDQNYTVPQVFLGNRHIGGCDDAISYLKQCLGEKVLLEAIKAQSTMTEGGHNWII